MNRYILLRRLTGPCILLLLGAVALLHEANLVSWHIFVPLLLILIGVLKLAQRAALAAAGDDPTFGGAYPGPGYPGPGYPGWNQGGWNPANPNNPYAAPGTPPVQPAQPGTAIVPTTYEDPRKGPNGGTQ